MVQGLDVSMPYVGLTSLHDKVLNFKSEDNDCVNALCRAHVFALGGIRALINRVRRRVNALCRAHVFAQ